MGGENLLEKAEEQERLLEESAKELQERKSKEEQLRKALHEKEVFLAQSNLSEKPLHVYCHHQS